MRPPKARKVGLVAIAFGKIARARAFFAAPPGSAGAIGASSVRLPNWILAGKRGQLQASAAIPDVQSEEEPRRSRRQALREAPQAIRESAKELRHELSERVLTFQERISSAVHTVNSDYVSPVRRLIENPVSIKYGVAMAARLSYFLAQQGLVSTAVDRKVEIDVPAVARAVVAAIANGREEELLETLRIPDHRLTSGESYEWWRANLRGIIELLQKEASAIEDGTYKFPADLNPSDVAAMLEYNPASVLASFAAYYRDQSAKKVEKGSSAASKSAKGGSSATATPSAVPAAAPHPTFVAPGRYPEYFLESNEDFLSARSARTVDYEFESTVWGMGDAMRRRALAQVDAALEGKDPEVRSLLDVGCGTGRFLGAVKDNFRRLRVTAMDLSLFSLQRARKHLEGRPDVTFVESNAEDIPLPNGSQDIITANFLLSRMPADAQMSAINEMARCLKRGGRLVIVDAAQPDFDGEDVCTFDGLPHFNKYATYDDYLKSDLEYALIKAGLFVQYKEISWVSKMLVAQKPPEVVDMDDGSAPGVGIGY